MPKDDRVRLRHMLDFTVKALHFAEGRARADLDEDELLALGLVRLLEMVGEAASQVSPPTRERLPGVPWRKAIGMRNILIHGYADLDLGVVWETIEQDLPPLRKALEEALRELG
jgi:uncharacterized protein with HEPN domain